MATSTKSDRDRYETLARRYFEEAFNEGRLDVVDELFSDTYGGLENAAFDIDPSGPELVKLGIERMRTAFPDFHIEIEEILVEGDSVAVHGRTSGTHDGDLVAGPEDDPFVAEPTGNRFENAGVFLMHFADGKVVEAFNYSDEFEMFIQLGIDRELADYERKHATYID